MSGGHRNKLGSDAKSLRLAVRQLKINASGPTASTRAGQSKSTDRGRSTCAAIARIGDPAFSPCAISGLSTTFNNLRTSNLRHDLHRRYGAMTRPSPHGLGRKPKFHHVP